MGLKHHAKSKNNWNIFTLADPKILYGTRSTGRGKSLLPLVQVPYLPDFAYGERTALRTVRSGRPPAARGPRGGGGGYNILARTTRLAQSLGNVPLIRN